MEQVKLPRKNYEMADDMSLIASALGGDGMAFEVIMRRNNQRLFRIARAILRDDAQAEDAVQQAYLNAWISLGNFRGDSSLASWLARITINESYARIRRHNANVIPLETAMLSPDPHIQTAFTERPENQPDAQALRAQLRALVEARIDALPESFRTVFVLREVEDLPVDDVAAMLDLPAATVRSRHFRARGLLREGLASAIDASMGDVFAFDGARCDRIVDAVLMRARAAGLAA